MIGSIFKELLALFIDDEFLALAILLCCGGISLLALGELISPLVTALLLLITLPAVLVASVMRGVRRARR